MDINILLPPILGFLGGGVLTYAGVWISSSHRTKGSRREWTMKSAHKEYDILAKDNKNIDLGSLIIYHNNIIKIMEGESPSNNNTILEHPYVEKVSAQK